jgi:hypothetical protein
LGTGPTPTFRGKKKGKNHRVRVFGNRVPRRRFDTKWDEVTGEWRRLQNEELNVLYSRSNIIRQSKSRKNENENDQDEDILRRKGYFPRAKLRFLSIYISVSMLPQTAL